MLLPAPARLLLRRDDPSAVRRLHAAAALHRVRPGVFVDRGEWSALKSWDRYLLRVHAVLHTWHDPVFSLESAAALLGLPVFGEPRYIHLLSADGSSWRRGDVIVHAAGDGRDVARIGATLLTTLSETAVDLARVLPPAFALAVADSALRRLGEIEQLDFRARGRGQENRRGVRQLDWIQERASAAAESAGESVSRAVIEWLGFEIPELQVKFRADEFTDRVDFFFPTARVIGESDGYGKYDAGDEQAMKRHFIREKVREDRLRRQVAGFARWDWSDAVRAAPLDAKLRTAGLSPIRPPISTLLRTLTRNPRSHAPLRNQAVVSKPTAR